MFKRISILSVAVIFLLITTTAFAGTVQLPQTGQTKCYDSVGVEIACAGTGQDGEIQAGVAWPNPRFIVSGDCVTDNLTGLMWTRNGNLPNSTKSWTQAIDYANNLTLCGYTDWRLPNVNELESLINANEPNSATWLNSQGFINVRFSYYWTSTMYASYPIWPWIIDMRTGLLNFPSSNSFFLWPVRSVQSGGAVLLPKTGQTNSYYSGDDGDLESGVVWPIPRFTDNGIGTVTDNLTGLVWSKDAKTPGPSVCNPSASKTWQGALDYVECLNTNGYLGYTDWRLPNRKEFSSLIDYSKINPALPTGYPFTNVQLDGYGYWLSTTIASSTSSAWYVRIGDGVLWYDSKSVGSKHVWPIRSGQVGGSFDYYCDNDSDTYFSSTISGTCTGSGCVPSGCQITPGDDCNDSNTLEHPNQTWYKDTDGDGYSDGSVTITCARPTGYKVASELTATSGDCDDNNSSVNQGATEIINNGIDDDCNPTTPINTASGSGYNYPEPSFRASLSLNVNASSLGTGYLKYSFKRMFFSSTSITGITAIGGTATVTGVGAVNNIAGCSFTATVKDGSPDAMGIVITPGGACTTSYSAPSKAVSSGNYSVVGE